MAKKGYAGLLRDLFELDQTVELSAASIAKVDAALHHVRQVPQEVLLRFYGLLGREAQTYAELMRHMHVEGKVGRARLMRNRGLAALRKRLKQEDFPELGSGQE